MKFQEGEKLTDWQMVILIILALFGSITLMDKINPCYKNQFCHPSDDFTIDR